MLKRPMSPLNWTTANPLSPKNRLRSPLRFTLRLLFAAVTVLSILLGIWTHRAREQRRLVERIRAAGGKVRYRPKSSMEFGPFGRMPIPQAIVGWLGNDYVYDVA